MSSLINRSLPGLGKRSLTREVAPEPDRSTKLEVYVIFTDTQGTLAALKMAGALAGNLRARITLLAPQVVPYGLALDQPPVSVPSIEHRLLELASQGVQGPLETVVHICLCRDRRQALLEILKPKSLVVVGGKGRWWLTWESRLARMLRSKGHHVIFAGGK